MIMFDCGAQWPTSGVVHIRMGLDEQLNGGWVVVFHSYQEQLFVGVIIRPTRDAFCVAGRCEFSVENLLPLANGRARFAARCNMFTFCAVAFYREGNFQGGFQAKLLINDRPSFLTW